MTKTVSARLPIDNHQELLERCNKAGCTVNEWLNAAVDYLLTGSSRFDFGDEEFEDDDMQNKVRVSINEE